MKTLPRSDFTLNEYVNFLKLLGIARSSMNSSAYVFAVPYSLPLTIGNDILICYASTTCKRIHRISNATSTLSISFKNMKIYSDRRMNVIPYKISEHIELLPRSSQSLIALFIKDIERIQILKEDLSKYFIEELQAPNSASNVHSIMFVDITGNSYSLAFSNPVYLHVHNKRVIEFSITKQSSIVVSERGNLITAYRLILARKFIGTTSNLEIEKEPLLEYLDYLTLAFPVKIRDNCITYKVFNPYDRAVNAVIKVYGYIDTIHIDNVTEYNYKHSVIRLALDPREYSEIELCISSKAPRISYLKKAVNGLDP